MSLAMPLPVDSTSVLDEQDLAVISLLERRMLFRRAQLVTLDRYYKGTQPVKDLGISLPPQMRGLNTVVDWPAICVDAIDERLDVEGFRYPGASDADEALWDIWQANEMDDESGLGHRDAMIFGHSYVTVGTQDDGSALITVESPIHMATMWDVRTKRIQAALRVYVDEPGLLVQIGQPAVSYATFYTPGRTVHMQSGGGTVWEVTAVDLHRVEDANGPVVPVRRLANRQRIYDRVGSSEITPAVMSVTDSVCRTLLGAEVAREFFAAPQRWIMGADEGAFQAADGTAKSAWETYTGRILALEANEEGLLPTVGQFQSGDPSAYTKLIDMYAKIMASMTGLPPHYLGYSSDNPTSADAIRSSEARLVKKAERRQRAFGEVWEDVMRLALIVTSQELPPGAARLATIWREASTPTVAQTADAAAKYVAAGVLPASSSVTLRKIGLDEAEIAQVQADRKRDGGESFLAEVASSLVAAEARKVGPLDKAAGVTPDGTPA